MAMDFFEHQDRARRRTGLLLFYFVLAVVLTILAVNVAVFLILSASMGPVVTAGDWLAQPWWMAITLGTAAVIGIGSLVRFLQLRQGGHVLATMLGARRLDPDTQDTKERRLLNLVEEMAIASGTPPPSTWVMDNETAINAFVAGFQPTEAVLVVTRGSLEKLDRDELQAVIGHEFSHLLNGDMRLNVQLYAILAGILLIGRIGEFLVRSTRRSRGSNRKGEGAPMAIGLALMVVGYVGLFFGRLIKAAISRQREFLADASSVQFTRNPDGMAEALLKIRNDEHGGLLDHSAAEDMSHMCFALPVRIRLAGLLATHPPLDERIRAIDAGYLVRDRVRREKAEAASSVAAGAAGTPLPPGVSGMAAAVAVATSAQGLAASAGTSPATTAAGATPAVILASVGTPTPAHLDAAAALRNSIPESVHDLMRTPAGARIVLYGLLIAGTSARHDETCLDAVARGDGDAIGKRLRAHLPVLRGLPPRLRLPCLELSLPALRELSPPQRQGFLDVLGTLAKADTRYTLSEFVLLAIVRRQLAEGSGALRPVRHRNFQSVKTPLALLFSLVAHIGAGERAAREALYERVISTFGIGVPACTPAAEITATRLQEALDELADLSPLLKKPVLDGCLDCAQHDGRLHIAEVELVRAIGATLDCPVPPLLANA